MKFKLLHALVVGISMSVSSMINVANAGLIFTVVEQGNDVVIEGSGNFDTNGLTIGRTGSDQGFANGSNALAVGNTNSTDYFSVIFSGDGLFGNGGWPGHGDLHSGVFFGFDVNGLIYLPQGYHLTVGQLLGTTTYYNSTIASLGLLEGQYNYEVNNDTIDLTIRQVPEPSTLAIFALGMMGLASRGFKEQS